MFSITLGKLTVQPEGESFYGSSLVCHNESHLRHKDTPKEPSKKSTPLHEKPKHKESDKVTKTASAQTSYPRDRPRLVQMKR